ncbi:MAG: type II secretion system protein [Candidatus Nomurabacteria bacterium]|nr:MAG: type II secretion system protein [Candidatus Nomurabacteria bacterium]
MNHEADNRSGFTIIELTLAMTFVSVLLIVIALTVIQIITIYNRGLTMQQVDQAGRAISTDIRQTLSQSQPFSISTALCLQKQLGACGASANDAYGGRLCTGTYSYVWNLSDSLSHNIHVNVYDNGVNKEIRFIRVRDNGGRYCANPDAKINESDATQLLDKGGHIALQSFNIAEIAKDPTTNEALYRVVMEIGTDDLSTVDRTASSSGAIDTIDTSCKPPSDSSSLQDFCAINHFDFTALAGNKGGNT